MIAVGGSVIAFGFLSNPEQEKPKDITPYEKLQNYKEDLEKINQYNREILKDLEQKITNSDDVDVEQVTEEIKVLKQVISENQAELKQVTQQLAEMESP